MLEKENGLTCWLILLYNLIYKNNQCNLLPSNFTVVIMAIPIFLPTLRLLLLFFHCSTVSLKPLLVICHYIATVTTNCSPISFALQHELYYIVFVYFLTACRPSVMFKHAFWRWVVLWQFESLRITYKVAVARKEFLKLQFIRGYRSLIRVLVPRLPLSLTYPYCEFFLFGSESCRLFVSW